MNTTFCGNTLSDMLADMRESLGHNVVLVPGNLDTLHLVIDGAITRLDPKLRGYNVAFTAEEIQALQDDGYTKLEHVAAVKIVEAEEAMRAELKKTYTNVLHIETPFRLTPAEGAVSDMAIRGYRVSAQYILVGYNESYDGLQNES